MDNGKLLWEKLNNEFFFERDGESGPSYSLKSFELSKMRRDVIDEISDGEKYIQVEIPYEDEGNEYYTTLSEIARKYGYELETYEERDKNFPLVEIDCDWKRNELSTLWKG